MTLELVPWRGANVPVLNGHTEASRFSQQDYLNWLQDPRWMGPPISFTSYGSKPAEPISQTFEGFTRGMLYADGPVAAAEAYRLRVFGQAPLLYQEITDGRPGDFFDDDALDRLRSPWPGATLSDLMKRALIFGDFAGNAFVVDMDDELVLVRPDWVEIVLAKREHRGGQVGWKQIGIVYYENGPRAGDGVSFLPGEYAHFVPGLPDPMASYRGMSWLTPLVREVQADKSAMDHKVAFFENAASPNLAVSLPKEITPTQFEEFVDKMDAKHKGAVNAYKTLYTAGGADVTVVGANMQQMDFSAVQGKGETRIANAAGVPPVLLSFSEGMQGSSLNAGNYTAAKRNFVDTTMRDLWQNWCGSVQQMEAFAPPKPKTRLWYDGRDIPFLHEDALDAANIQQILATTITVLVREGFVPDTVIPAVIHQDMSLLKHSGLTSVQLQPPGTPGEPGAADQQQAADQYQQALDQLRADLYDDEPYIERKYYDVRVPKGYEGGGRFRSMSDRIGHALNEWLSGKGDQHDPLEEFSREQLRVASKEFGITPRRGASAEELKLGLLHDARARFHGAKAAKSPDAGKPVRFTLTSGKLRNLDVGVFTEPSGKLSLWEVSDSGQRRRRVAVADDLAGLEKWANDNGETHLADWARKERGGAEVAKARPAKAAESIPTYNPPESLSPEDRSRAKRLVRADPQIFATVQRYGPISTSGNLSNEDAAWLQSVFEREPAFVNRLAQDAYIDSNLRRAAKQADQTPTEFNGAVADKLRGIFADKPVALRVSDESALRGILSEGRLRTQFDKGTKRAGDLRIDLEHRRLGEQVMGVAPDTPPDQRPVYGYVAINGIEPALSPGKKISGIAQREGQEDVLSQYGQVQVVLKPGVRSRTTATVGDSLDRLGMVQPSPVDHPSAGSAGVGYGFKVDELDRLTQPGWTRRSYVEAQIHGGVRTGDIAEVVFPSQPEAGTRSALADAGIPWRVLAPGQAPDVPAKATTPAAKKAVPAPSTPDLAHLRTLDRETARDQLDLLKVDQIKPLLREQGLPVSGRKRELVDRLVDSVHGGDGSPAAPAVAVRPSGLPTDRKLVSGDFDDLASRLIGKSQQQLLEIFADLNASELARLARKYPGTARTKSLVSHARGGARGLQIPDGLTLDERRLWLAKELTSRRNAWRSAEPDDAEIERHEDSEDESLEDDEEIEDPTLDEIHAMAAEAEVERSQPDDRSLDEVLAGLDWPEPDETIEQSGPMLAAHDVESLGAEVGDATVARALGHDITPGHEQFKHYWTETPEGLAKWAGKPKPWTALFHHLARHIPIEMAKRVAAQWFHRVFHFWPGSDLNRVTHGKPPRGHRVGPG